MYADPSLIRDHVVTVRFSDTEADLVGAAVNYTGQQRAVFLRELILDGVKRALFSESKEAAQMNLNLG
jgi:hypothetical protein